MAPDRDTLLRDLKNHVIEIFYLRGLGLKTNRLSLREDLLPKDFTQDPDQLNIMETYHSTHPFFIGAWNVNEKKWEYIDVNTISYVQIIDGY